MKETIEVIENALNGNKEVLRRLEVEQNNFIKALSDNFYKKNELLNINMRLERQLKDIYDEFCRRDQCSEKMTDAGMSTMKASISSAIKASHGEDYSDKNVKMRG